MNLRIITPLIILAALAVGCGSSQASNAPGADITHDTHCQQQLAKWTSALHALNSRLDIGMNENEYNSRLGDLQVIYDRVPTSSLGIGCNLAAVSYEGAENSYIKANTYWNACIQKTSCTDATMKRRLQKDWSDASGLLKYGDKQVAQLQ